MSLEAFNGYVFIPNVYQSENPTWLRKWTSGVEAGLRRGEERMAMRETARERLSFTVHPTTLQEWAIFEERVYASLKAGKAACPFWGRASELALDVTGASISLTTDSIWPWAVGDYIFLRQPIASRVPFEGSWNVRQITAVAGTTLTLAGAVNQTFKKGALVWPLFYGSLSVQGFALATNHRAPVRLTFGDQISVTAEPEAGCGGIYPVILAKKQTSCDVQAKLRWNRSVNAAKYRVYKSKVEGGPYELVQETDARSILVDRPFALDDFYVVRAVRGDVESEDSNEVKVIALTIEQLMCAMQERYRQGRNWKIEEDDLTGDWLVWPQNAAFEAAAKYPEKDFYLNDLYPDGTTEPIDADRAAVLIQALADGFNDYWVTSYVNTDAEGNFDGEELVPIHSVNGPFPDNGVKKLFTGSMPALVVTNLNYEAKLRECLSRLCSLNFILVSGTQVETAVKTSGVYSFKYSESFGVITEFFAVNPASPDVLNFQNISGWSSITWGQQYSFRWDNSDEVVPVTFIPGIPYGVPVIDEGPGSQFAGIGAKTYCSNYVSRAGEFGNHWAWQFVSSNTRGKVQCDLSSFTRNEKKTCYLWVEIASKNYATIVPAPFELTAEPVLEDVWRLRQWGKWADVPVNGAVWTSAYVTKSEDQVPIAYTLFTRYFGFPPYETDLPSELSDRYDSFEVTLQMVEIDKRGKWEHHPDTI